MINIKSNDLKLSYPSVYNIRPILNEISIYHCKDLYERDEEDCVLDEYYGTVFSASAYERMCPYGISSEMLYYDCMGNYCDNYKVVDYFRVPYGKIPIYEVADNRQAEQIIQHVTDYNRDYNILFRGQGSYYTINRSSEERDLLYGESKAKEPSFLSSHCRPNINLDEKFLQSLWNWQGRMLLNDIGVDLYNELPNTEYMDYFHSKQEIEGTFKLSLFSLGIAQHYGMPSVGLDLTDDYRTALCFASNKFTYDSNNNLNVKLLDDFSKSMIYVFRCPRNVVFPYSYTKPKNFPKCRPDCQHAWFGHVGWGFAKNQMGMYLACCIKVTKEMYASIDQNYLKSLFPSSKDDPVLEHFLKIKRKSFYDPAVINVVNRIYDVIF